MSLYACTFCEHEFCSKCEVVCCECIETSKFIARPRVSRSADPVLHIPTSEPRELWLNGHHRDGAIVLVGTMICCVGCGKWVSGPICVVIDENTPGKEPDWPFDVETCPLRSQHTELGLVIRAEPEAQPQKMIIKSLVGKLPK